MSDTDPKDESASTSTSTETHTPTPSSPSQASSQADTPSPSQADAYKHETESEAETSEPQSSTTDTPPTLDQARSFLRDAVVRRESPARKAAFLAAKGLSGEDIGVLLEEQCGGGSDEVAPAKDVFAPATAVAASAAPTLPPIVTYPEFVANASQPPPPLVTPRVLATALYGTAATSSLLYAAAKLVLAPMVDALTSARSELHATAGGNLATLQEKLERVVSVVPATDKTDDAKSDDSVIDDTSSYGDPSEVFHRDIGVQTSLPSSPALPAITMDSGNSFDKKVSTSQVQADRVASLVASVRALSQGWAGSTDVQSDIQTTIQTFSEDVDKLSRPPPFTYGNGGIYKYGSAVSSTGTGSAGTSGARYTSFVTTTRNEPDDEIRKAKENIRRVKGALLSTRTFPTSGR